MSAASLPILLRAMRLPTIAREHQRRGERVTTGDAPPALNKWFTESNPPRPRRRNRGEGVFEHE